LIDDGERVSLIFFVIIYELLPFGLMSLTLRPGGNDCLTFSAFSLSATITEKKKTKQN